MATRQLRNMNERGDHNVGNLCSWKIKTVPNGAKCLEDIDNFLLVELSYDAEGVRSCKTLTDVTKKAYLIASPEIRMLGNVSIEEMVDFFNGEGEYARIVLLEMGFRFDTAAFVENVNVTEITNGLVAHFDPASKKFIVSNPANPHADYANASVKFEVANMEGDTEYSICGKSMVRLEVQ
jgi:hypothetical protein